MIGRGFKSVGWVAAVGAAALGCYMLSLKVATERAELARVERQIISTKQQIRSLQTELGTRGRLTQLEQWNQDVLALAAPASGQFLQDEFTLARLETGDPTLADQPPVRMAALEAGRSAPSGPATAVASADQHSPTIEPNLVHRASFTPTAPRSEVTSAAQVQLPAKKSPVEKTVPATSKSKDGVSPRSALARVDQAKPEPHSTTGVSSGSRPVARNEIARTEPAPSPATRSSSRRSDRLSTTAIESGKPARSAGDKKAAQSPSRIATTSASGATGRK